MTDNIILNVDSYKASHYLQYPPGITHLSAYIESRGGEFDELIFFGLQAFIKEYLLTPFTKDDIDEAENLFVPHGVPFNREGWEHILHEHGGLLPLEIQALPEGTCTEPHQVLVQVINTDEKCFWLSAYIETIILRAVWYPTTVASLSRNVRNMLMRYMLDTCDNLDGLPYILHDFGSRGASSRESAALGGMGHLLSFTGSDTIAAIMAARRFYGEAIAGFSIPAAEHSTITSWGKDGELDGFKNMLDTFLTEGKAVSVVSDSYNIWRSIDEFWGDALKDQIINSGGRLVVRPDSGDPVNVVCLAMEKLFQHFGYTENSKGYRVLPDCIRLIQGDGLDPELIYDILNAMKQKKISTDNIVFGMGGALLQRLDRDTMKFAMKASAVKVNGEWRGVYKDPSTAPGKRSKQGRLAAVINENGNIETILEKDLNGRENQLQTVYRNGQLMVDMNFSDIKARANSKPKS
jgi:nicotinamide phosphoribosyltransferase